MIEMCEFHKFSPTFVLLIFGFQWFQIKQLWRVFTTVFARVFPLIPTLSGEKLLKPPWFLKHFEGPLSIHIFFRMSQTSWPEDACVVLNIIQTSPGCRLKSLSLIAPYLVMSCFLLNPKWFLILRISLWLLVYLRKYIMAPIDSLRITWVTWVFLKILAHNNAVSLCF